MLGVDLMKKTFFIVGAMLLIIVGMLSIIYIKSNSSESIFSEETVVHESIRGETYNELVIVSGNFFDLRLEIYTDFGVDSNSSIVFDDVNVEALTEEYNALKVMKREPRIYLADSIEEVVGDVISNLNGYDMRLIKSANVSIFEVQGSINELQNNGPYTKRIIEAFNSVTYYENSKIYQLVDPSGNIYVMYTATVEVVNDNLSELDELGNLLNLPDNWTYQVVTLDEDLVIYNDGTMTLINDDLNNTYQLVTNP